MNQGYLVPKILQLGVSGIVLNMRFLAFSLKSFFVLKN